LIDLLYSRIARARRRYYERRPHLRRRLGAPVISIGNLTVGGSGKTPLAAEIARLLIDLGERPAILSRGYARTAPLEGVVIVGDGAAIRAGVEHCGDEPLMLARMVPNAAVLVASRRYFAGRVAESALGCTVHVLDDGFQHFDLMRDVDLLVAPEAEDVRTLPTGRLREPLDAAAAADALLVEEPGGDAGLRQAVPAVFTFSRRLAGPPPDRPAYAFAGIARPERFYRDLKEAGWDLRGSRSFRDHHPYSRRDLDAVVNEARASGAQVLLTTEKDAVRLGSDPTTQISEEIREIAALGSDPRTGTGVRPPYLPIVPVPQQTSIDPAFRPWLSERLRALRGRRR